MPSTVVPDYPRLPWRRLNDDWFKNGFEAHPYGESLAPRAQIDLGGGSAGYEWRWSVYWPGRFNEVGFAASRQDAADSATLAFWDNVREKAAGLIPEPETPPVIGTLVDFDDAALTALRRRYHRALAYGDQPSIEADSVQDQKVYDAIFAEQQRRAGKLTRQ